MSYDDDTGELPGAQAALAPALYLAATPIGNLGDITLRALAALRGADLIAAEDTRRTGQLLTHFGIKKPLLACHDHNEDAAAQKIIAAVQTGQRVVLVSDAGTPLLADPGYRIMQAALAAGIPVTALPGANAILPALQLSGLPSDRFSFLGFLPQKRSERLRYLEQVKTIPITLIIYETPHRLLDALDDILVTLGDRPIAVARELTKKFEEVKRGPVRAVIAHYQQHEPRGEIVLVIAGAAKTADKMTDAVVTAQLTEALASGAPFRETVDLVTEMSGWPKRQVYNLAAQLKHGLSHES